MKRTILAVLAFLFLAAPGVQAQYTYTTNADSTLTITGYTGVGGALTIPTNIDGLTVTCIGDGAFMPSLSLITSITMLDGITSIGDSAFAGPDLILNTSLTSVTIPGTVTNMGAEVFIFCIRLTNATIANGVTSIGNNDFFYCRGLTSITIPGSVTNIGTSAFNSCHSLATVTISNGVTSIESWAFAETGLASVAIPASVINIGDYAFAYTALTNIAIPNTVTNVGIYAFDGCLASSVTIPNYIASIPVGMFAESGLTNVAIPDGVTNIGAWAFSYCFGLRSVTMGNSVTNIEDLAFNTCSSLSAVYFEGNAPSIGSSVFSYDPNLIFYYQPGTTGWASLAQLTGAPTVLWNPSIQSGGANFGVQNNVFGFTITGTTNIPIVVAASTNLAGGAWTAVQSCNVTNGSIYFSDPAWTNYSSRYYRICWP